MNEKMNPLGRLDRAIAENLQDIRSCFEADAGIVLDFIVFISLKVKTDLFGYSRFTLKEFCEVTGRHRQDLARRHPVFTDSQRRPPEIEGFRFESVFDYVLVTMMQRNLIFSKVVHSREDEQVVRIEAIRILRDVKINFSRKSNEVKIYEVRLSQELLNGFLRRYYTIDVQAYKEAGKGRGKEQRQSLVIYLSVLRHILFSQSAFRTVIPLENLARHANVASGKTTFHTSEAVSCLLNFIKSKTSFKFDFHFLKAGTDRTQSVELIFDPPGTRRQLVLEHNFYFLLFRQLRDFFESSRQKTAVDFDDDDSEAFQTWLTSGNDQVAKLGILKYCYQQVFNKQLTDQQAGEWMNTGLENR